MKGLAPHTQQIFEAVSKLDCIKPYLLVGGVKFSFYACPKYSPADKPVDYLNHVRLADVKALEL